MPTEFCKACAAIPLLLRLYVPHFGFRLPLSQPCGVRGPCALNMIQLAMCLFIHGIFQHYHVPQFEADVENFQNSKFDLFFLAPPEFTMADKLPAPASALHSATSSELAPSAPTSVQPNTYTVAMDTFGANTWAERNPEKVVQGGRI